MEDDETVMVTCPICSCPSRLRKENLFSCDDCRHVFQWPATITVKYDDEYVGKYDSLYPTSRMSDLRLGFIKGFVGGGNLLDVGYGNGSFVKLASSSGYDAFGKEIHGLSDRYGVREADYDSKEWDVVTFFDSLEHMDSLSTIRKLRSKIIIVSTPLRPDTFPDDLRWKHWKPGEHLHYFDSIGILRLWPTKKKLAESNIEDIIRKGFNKNILTIVLSD